MAISIEKSVHGIQNLDVASSCNRVGLQYFNKGDYDKAMEFLVDAVRVRRQILGNDSPIVAENIRHIGLVHKNKSEHDLAIKRFKEVLRIEKLSLLSDKHLKIAQTMYDIGMIYHTKEDFPLSLNWLNNSLVEYEKSGLPKNDKRVLNAKRWVTYLKKKIKRKLTLRNRKAPSVQCDLPIMKEEDEEEEEEVE